MDQPASNLLQDRLKILDGFRGLAILLVCGYHYLHFFSFGWTGVDLFFVLSGFLITGKLAESLGSKNYFSTFYIKRILRIVPLYYTFLLIFFVIIPLLLPSYVSLSFKELLQQQWYYWTFTANIYDAVHGWPRNVTVIHCWSLACEMQFYLVWPFVVYFFYNKGKLLATMLVLLVLLGLLLRTGGAYFISFNSIYRYVLLPCRIDAFAGGALLYMVVTRQQPGIPLRTWLLVVLAVSGCTGLTMVVLQTPWHFAVDAVSKYGLTLNALFWTAFIGLILSPGAGAGKRIFSGSILAWLGKYSYGIYIFHWPVYIITARQQLFNTGTEDKTPLLAATAFALTLLCSVASYHLLEKHFLKLKPAR